MPDSMIVLVVETSAVSLASISLVVLREEGIARGLWILNLDSRAGRDGCLDASLWEGDQGF